MEKFYKKVLCVADSLGLPREGVSYEETWFYRITTAKENYHFIPKFKRALDTDEIAASGATDFLELYQPNVVILQVGIVDCSPRFLPNKGRIIKLINFSPSFLKKTFWKIWKKYRKREAKYADVSPEKFRKNLNSYFQRCKNNGVEKVIFICISMPTESMVKKNQEIKNQVSYYNEIIKEVASNFSFVSLINPLNSGDTVDFIEDGYHINGVGSEKILKSILEQI